MKQNLEEDNINEKKEILTMKSARKYVFPDQANIR